MLMLNFGIMVHFPFFHCFSFLVMSFLFLFFLCPLCFLFSLSWYLFSLLLGPQGLGLKGGTVMICDTDESHDPSHDQIRTLCGFITLFTYYCV